MKTTDIHRIRDGGLITEDQSAAIIDHFKLDQQANKLMIILGAVGALLVGSGIILLLAANWADIPRGVKLAPAIAALIGAHYSGWRLAQSGDHPGFYQPCLQLNYPGPEVDFTRIVEYKHKPNQPAVARESKGTVIFKEYSCDHGEPY